MRRRRFDFDPQTQRTSTHVDPAELVTPDDPELGPTLAPIPAPGSQLPAHDLGDDELAVRRRRREKKVKM